MSGGLLPLELAGPLVERPQTQLLNARDDDGVLMQDGTAADAAILSFQQGQFFPPGDLSIEIQRHQHAGSEHCKNVFAVSDRRRHCVHVVEVVDHAFAGRNDRVPQRLAIGRAEAEDVMFANGCTTFLFGDVSWPDCGGQKDAVAPDNRAGPAGAGEFRVLFPATVQQRFPDDVFAGLSVPRQRQSFFRRVTKARRTAPARPVFSLARIRRGQRQQSRESKNTKVTEPKVFRAASVQCLLPVEYQSIELLIAVIS